MMEQELRVPVLGGAELAVSGRPLVELASAKAAALLFYLAVTGAGHSRSVLAGLLWSDLPEPTARANLRLVLTKLRRVLPEHLEVTRQAVALASGQPVWVDAVEVGRVAASERDGGELLAAVRLCRGDFLEGFGAPGAPLFDEWLSGATCSAHGPCRPAGPRPGGRGHRDRSGPSHAGAGAAPRGGAPRADVVPCHGRPAQRRSRPVRDLPLPAQGRARDRAVGGHGRPAGRDRRRRRVHRAGCPGARGRRAARPGHGGQVANARPAPPAHRAGRPGPGAGAPA